MNSSVHIRLPDNNFGHQLGEIQNAFKKSYHAELHAALTIYATAICLEGIVLIIAFISFLGIDVAWVFGGFSVVCVMPSPFSRLESPALCENSRFVALLYTEN